nr:hypothetical protein [Tanacetum cinerariifolium]
MLLEDAIAANVSRSEKKKRCRVVFRTHGVSSAHHARSDGVPVSMPTVVPKGLAVLLANASIQTETSEGDASPRLLRSKSLPPMYNLDCPWYRMCVLYAHWESSLMRLTSWMHANLRYMIRGR